MSRSYRHSPEFGANNTEGKRQTNRRTTRRDRRLIQQIADMADAFVSPLRTAPTPQAAGGFRSERQFSNPANSTPRRY
ncbi:MAG: hypothetical protein K2Y39_11285 [Candidatus Obscuribacterales bacterium]|nr:hypothetical protein [Candidatus Obscuribacterales bacterium]